MCDNIDFVLADPVEKGEKWAMEYTFPHSIAEIYINGRELIDILKAEELPYAGAEGHPSLAGSYGHISPEKLYNALKYSISADGRAALLCCGECGDVGCWSVSVYTRKDEKYVYWYKFEHDHRKWQYSLGYKFSAYEYEKALEKLNGMY